MKSLVLFLLSVVSLFAQAPASPLATEIRAIIDEYENSVRANTQKLIAAATEEEKNKFRASIPSAGPYATKMMKLVQANLDQPDVVKGVNWLVTGAASFPEGQEALKMLGTTFAGSKGIAESVKQLEYHGLPAEPVLKAVIEKNKNREEKAAALYALGAIHFKNFDASADRVSGEASKEKALECFQQLNADYADVTIQGFKLSDFTAKMLFEMMNLQVGCEAPEIEGMDADGVSFKLSDYRGKHVIVIFWGGWCHACHGILPLMNQTAAQLKDKNAVVIGVNTDIETEAKKALADYQVSFRNILDNTSSGPNTTLYNLRNFPTLYLIDPKGVIAIKNGALEAMVSHINAAK
ncbi:TlpA disulfide reductase family protein [Prosthecobacter sp.]|uniref:peroxiredoxin family protein n=1 Tax=Prosthecobacter sp. TaxID=1965333 RepID=UPI002AB875FB|nr:TlpA disulfide reductase family protein [Prosthecobacter sp.]MDZ4403810.1 TlpA disulfide reductase family protein [Prosthecobacter sp.]